MGVSTTGKLFFIQISLYTHRLFHDAEWLHILYDIAKPLPGSYLVDLNIRCLHNRIVSVVW